MDAFLIEGPAKLSGRVNVSGSKNASLPLLFSSLIFDEPMTFENVPRLWDVETTLKLLGLIGCRCEWDKANGKVVVHPAIKSTEAPYDLVKKMRAGILALGPLVAKAGEARVSLPGGCAIGARPVNFHIEAMEKMGVEVNCEEGYISAKVKDRLRGAEIVFPQVTVTGTENLLVLAACAEGRSVLENAAMEPEVVALGEVLRDAGADITGLGTPKITIHGAKLRRPKQPVVIGPDRIETGTWIAIAVATRSELEIANVRASDQTSVMLAFQKMGVEFEVSNDGSVIKVKPPEMLQPVDVETEPFPGFATDMQAQVLATLCLANGTSRIRENIFENRFMHVAELRRLGAKVTLRGNLAVVKGPATFKAAPMMATDLRASASLVIAALAATGTTRISRIYHLDRGYQRLDEKLNRLGAKVVRVQE